MRKPSVGRADGLLSSPVRNLISILGFMALVVVASTLAYMHAGWSFTDASYMVGLIIYTVGFEEVRPVDTPYLHAVTMTTMVLGCTGMILLTSALVQFLTERQLRQLLGSTRMKNRIDKLTDHVVICGYGRIGVMLAQELADAGMPSIVIESSAERLSQAEAAGHLFLQGDATSESILLAAGIQRARVLATVLPDDAANVFITLSARSLNPKVEIIARGEAPTTERKLRQAGADEIVLPTHIGAERIARMILYPRGVNLGNGAQQQQTDQALGDLGLRLELVIAVEGSAVAGLSVADAERRGGGTFLIVRLGHATGSDMARPDPADIIKTGDRALIVARDGGGGAHALFSTRAEAVRIGRNTY